MNIVVVRLTCLWIGVFLAKMWGEWFRSTEMFRMNEKYLDDRMFLLEGMVGVVVVICLY